MEGSCPRKCRWRWVVVLTSTTLFIVSLTQTAFVVDVSYSFKRYDHSGVDLLITGWAGVFDGLNVLSFPSIIAAMGIRLQETARCGCDCSIACH